MVWIAIAVIGLFVLEAKFISCGWGREENEAGFVYKLIVLAITVVTAIPGLYMFLMSLPMLIAGKGNDTWYGLGLFVGGLVLMRFSYVVQFSLMPKLRERNKHR